MNATPTLPDNLNMLLGVAYILMDCILEDSAMNSPTVTDPVPITRLKIRKDALKRPRQTLGQLTYVIKKLLTQLSSRFGYIIVAFTTPSCSASELV